MKYFPASQYLQKTVGAAPRSSCFALVLLSLVIAFLVVPAGAQSTQNQPTVTVLYSGTADFNKFGLESVTFPQAGQIISGTAPSQFTNPIDNSKNPPVLFCIENHTPCNPVRHLWYGDSSNGLCRVGGEIDDPDTTEPQPGHGKFPNIIQSCIGNIQASGFVPSQVSYDPTTQMLYASDMAATPKGIIRMHFVPDGDSGNGAIDPITVRALMGSQTGHNAAGGCPVVSDPLTGAIGAQMNAAAIGPDGALYFGWKRQGYVMKIPNAATFDPTQGGACSQIQVPLWSADTRAGAGHTFGLAWIGHTLFGADNIAAWVLPNGDQCFTPQNGNIRCGPTGPTSATEILANFAPGPQSGITSDFRRGVFDGQTLYIASVGDVTRVTQVDAVSHMITSPEFGGAFCFISGVTIDPAILNNETIYIGNDCQQGSINGAGAIWQVTPVPLNAAPPATPNSVSASDATPIGAGATGGQVTVTWIPANNGQPITSFLVHTVLASDGVTSPVADVVVGPISPQSQIILPTATVTGLQLGVAVEFQVLATNANGNSPFTALSNAVTPTAPTVPNAPTNVSAIAGDTTATVAWTAPFNGRSAITSFTATSSPGGFTATAPGNATGVTVTGLTDGVAYTFTVTATNAVGTSAPGGPSNSVTPVAQTQVDLAITASSPASVNPNSFVKYTFTITNNGPATAPSVIFSDTLPSTFEGSTTTQGQCQAPQGASLTCNLGAMTAGSVATVTVTVLGPASGSISDTGTVAFNNANGSAGTDTFPANNSASATTTVTTGGGGGQVNADIQVGGSASNGGPNVGTADTFTWQIKDNTGNQGVTNVVFTLPIPASFQFASASANLGSCSGVNAGQFGGTLTCTAASLGGGQTMIVTVNVTVTQAGSIPSTGSATFNGTDTNPNNNSFTVTIQPK